MSLLYFTLFLTLQVYLDISKLDYTTQHFIFVKKDGVAAPEKYHCPKKITKSVAAIVHNRIQVKSSELKPKNRISLLKQIVLFEDLFVEGVCKTFV